MDPNRSVSPRGTSDRRRRSGERPVYFDQMEVRRNTGVYGDLYEWSRRSGRVR